jgi:hypothetical protein
MTQRDFSVRLASALSVGFVLAGVCVRDAFAVPTDYGVEWAFVGTVVDVPSSLSTSGCCNVVYGLGDTVTGSIQLQAAALGGSLGSVHMDLPGGGQVSWSSDSGSPAHDGSGGNPDTVSIFNVLGDGELVMHTQPGWAIFEADGLLSLIDVDGTAWTGLNPRTGDVPPDYPPDISVFETHEIDLNLFAFSLTGGTEQPGGQLRIRIDGFPVPAPEPGTGVLALAALAGLAAVRSSARASRRGGRALAR